MMRLILFALFAVGLIWGKATGNFIDHPAPDFELLNQDGVPVRLSDYRGQWVVVYFYPKDDTPGCTKEACGFRNDFNKFAEQDIIVLGISYDSPHSHKAFIKKYDLPFTLLADTAKSVAALYDSKGIFFANRKTFLIDPTGVIRYVYEKVDVTTHAEAILQKIAELAAER
ncbi:MAG: peroxiredoxin [Candidatus Marinimicrobia bacterium]|nr:peroxiredoxin [Candidatus Neomarinimicrobiota bacterium]